MASDLSNMSLLNLLLEVSYKRFFFFLKDRKENRKMQKRDKPLIEQINTCQARPGH